MAGRGHGRDAQPFLRLRPSGGELRRDGRHVGPAAGRHRRRGREHVARARWARTAPASTAETSSCARESTRSRRESAPTSSPPSRVSPARTSIGSRSLLKRRPTPRARRAASRRACCRSWILEAGRSRSTEDEHPRPDTTLEGLASLAPAFADGHAGRPNGETLDQIALRRYPEVDAIRHVHTAGNSSGIVDGAAAVLLASEDYVKAHGLKPRARIRSTGDRRGRAGDHADRARAGLGARARRRRE